MQRTFSTPDPVSLYVELRSGDLVVTARDTDETVVDVTGRDADDPRTISVEQHGDKVTVVALAGRHGFFGSSQESLSVHITVPTDTRITSKLGSADLRVEGRIGDSLLRTGSGEIRVDELGGETIVETGSGDVWVQTAAGALRVKCGSGDVYVDRLDGPADISTGSGDVTVDVATAPVKVKSGSGSTRVRDAAQDLALNTASGDLVVDRIDKGQIVAKNVSGDIRVGVPAGVPVWTDITSMTGAVRSNLAGAGEPSEGQDYVQLRAKTVSGDIYLEERNPSND
jgi:DUF4097 and DUF4098 domain-containing protein YvlB